ncbi:MAG: class I SAM-dependent methyltransferase [Burkholderiales bacterium]
MPDPTTAATVTPSRSADDNALRSAPSRHCAACGREGVPLYDGLTDYLSGTPGTWRMARCPDEACGLLWLDPKPLAEDLVKAYTGYHTHGRAVRRSGVRLGRSALNTACKLASHLLELGSDLGRQRRALRTMFLGELLPGKLLEIGCGSGRFLDRMRRLGWDVRGTEFDPEAAARIRRRYGLRVDVGELHDLAYEPDAFDAIALSQVVEHVHDPLRLLAECRRLLRPGGRLVLTTPNARSVGHRRYGRAWRGLEPPRHLHLFTPASLAACARAGGLHVVQLRTLSAESAGIYRASDAIRRSQGECEPISQAGSIVRSWWLRCLEYRRGRHEPDAGQDLLLLATK